MFRILAHEKALDCQSGRLAPGRVQGIMFRILRYVSLQGLFAKRLLRKAVIGSWLWLSLNAFRWQQCFWAYFKKATRFLLEAAKVER